MSIIVVVITVRAALAAVLAATAIISIPTAVPSLTTTARAATSEAAPNHRAVTIRLVGGRVAVPSRMRPGVALLRNPGSHPVWVFVPTGSAGRTQLARALNAGGPEAVTAHFAVVDLLRAHTDAYLRLHRGHYYLADASARHYSAARIATVYVRGHRSRAALPNLRTVRVTTTGTLAVPSHRLPHRGHLRLTNNSATLQEVCTVPVAPGVTARALRRFLAAPSADGLSLVASVRRLRILTVFSPDRTVSPQYRLAHGRSLLISFGYGDGDLHHGQVRLVTAAG